MKRKLKKILCGLMAGLLVAVTVPAMMPESAYVTEVQAAAKIATPKLVSAKASGKNKILFKWKAVKGVSGYRIYRKEKGGSWKVIGNVKGAKRVSFTDSKTIRGVQYIYTVKAFKKSKGKTRWSGYNKKGVTTVAGLSTLKLNSSKVTLYKGRSCLLRVNGTKAVPTWKSSNKKIATVTKNGKVTAKSAGTAKITATLFGRKMTCTVTVKNPISAKQKMAQKYTALKNYINKHGYPNEDGNIAVIEELNANKTLMLSHVKRVDKMNFVIIIRDNKANTFKMLDIIVNCTKADNAEIYFSMSYGKEGNFAKANIKPSTYNGNNITFFDDSGKIVPAEVQKAANATMRTTMLDTESYLKNKMKISLRDLGFKAYNF